MPVEHKRCKNGLEVQPATTSATGLLVQKILEILEGDFLFVRHILDKVCFYSSG